jgi:predicted esterase
VLAVLWLGGACRADDGSTHPVPVATQLEGGDAAMAPPRRGPSVSMPSDVAVLAPLNGPWLAELGVEGFADVRVSVPLGATTVRPVVVALHGRGDRPEWACGEWRGITNAYPFIVCPHGIPTAAPAGSGLAYPDAETTHREVRGGLAALDGRFAPYVASGAVVLAGFSLGAMRAVRIALADSARFPRLALGEGGYDWSIETAQRFAQGGGQRVLFICSTRACEAAAARAAHPLDGAGVGTKIVSAGHIGHLVDDRVVAAARPAFRWLVNGDPRFAH